MKNLLIVSTLILSSISSINANKPKEVFRTSWSGSAPFCLVDNNGFMAQCYYYSSNDCLRAANRSNGSFCTMNPNR